MNGTIPQHPQAVNGQHPTAAGIPHGPALLPEAPCTMNGFVKIGRHETRDHQCTGRGTTPEEAAANFFGCIEALEAGYAARATRTAAPPPLASRTQRLGLLLACGLEKAVGKGDWKLVERLGKAAALVLAGRVVQTEESIYQVRSQAEPETTAYTVAGRDCTCQDARKHETDETAYWCKHTCAAVLFHKLAAQESGE